MLLLHSFLRQNLPDTLYFLPVAPNVSLVPPSTQVTPTQTTPLTPLMQLSALPYMGMSTTTLLTQPRSMGGVDRRGSG